MSLTTPGSVPQSAIRQFCAPIRPPEHSSAGIAASANGLASARASARAALAACIKGGSR